MILKFINFLKSLFLKKRVKILICGEARHGKDTVAELLNSMIGLEYKSSSDFVGRILYKNILKEKYGYKTFEECFEDRVTKRDEWYNLICEYNEQDRARTAKEILKVADIYVGMRDNQEFEASKNLFDIKIWVDASERLPKEKSSSNKLNKTSFDIIIENNESYEKLVERVGNISKLIAR